MYFNPQVKEKNEDFFNFEILRKELEGVVENRLFPLIVVHGLRRTGKSSIIRVVLNSLKKKFLWIDGRNISTQKDFYGKISEGTGKMKPLSIKSVSIKGIEFGLNSPNEGLDYLNRKRAVLVIDEAQLLKKFRVDYFVAYVYDNYPNIKIILSGSESGMLMNFLGKTNSKAPLYGRAIFELKTGRLEQEGSYAFLREGGKQAKLNFKEEEIIEAVGQLDGIIGWLTKYGWYRLKLKHEQALQKTIDDGKTIAKEEFIRFASRAEHQYLAIIKALKGGAEWKNLAKKIKTSKKQLYTMLKRMIGYGFVEKTGGNYSIADPLLEAAF